MGKEDLKATYYSLSDAFFCDNVCSRHSFKKILCAFTRGCIARFQDCPLCGLDIDSIVSDPEMQALVDTFIEGHARSKRSTIHALLTEDGQEENSESPDNKIKYEDISVERGSFLVQQAMRVRKIMFFYVTIITSIYSPSSKVGMFLYLCITWTMM